MESRGYRFGVSMLSVSGNEPNVELLAEDGISGLISGFGTSFDVPKKPQTKEGKNV